MEVAILVRANERWRHRAVFRDIVIERSLETAFGALDENQFAETRPLQFSFIFTQSKPINSRTTSRSNVGASAAGSSLPNTSFDNSG